MVKRNRMGLLIRHKNKDRFREQATCMRQQRFWYLEYAVVRLFPEQPERPRQFVMGYTKRIELSCPPI